MNIILIISLTHSSSWLVAHEASADHIIVLFLNGKKETIHGWHCICLKTNLNLLLEYQNSDIQKKWKSRPFFFYDIASRNTGGTSRDKFLWFAHIPTWTKNNRIVFHVGGHHLTRFVLEIDWSFQTVTGKQANVVKKFQKLIENPLSSGNDITHAAMNTRRND